MGAEEALPDFYFLAIPDTSFDYELRMSGLI
jgi:hypothetical protein